MLSKLSSFRQFGVASLNGASRTLATSAAAVQKEAPPKKSSRPEESKSFCMNLFRGKPVYDQAFRKFYK